MKKTNPSTKSTKQNESRRKKNPTTRLRKRGGRLSILSPGRAGAQRAALSCPRSGSSGGAGRALRAGGGGRAERRANKTPANSLADRKENQPSSLPPSGVHRVGSGHGDSAGGGWRGGSPAAMLLNAWNSTAPSGEVGRNDYTLDFNPFSPLWCHPT